LDFILKAIDFMGRMNMRDERSFLVIDKRFFSRPKGRNFNAAMGANECGMPWLILENS
jgi:hypothetical protein